MNRRAFLLQSGAAALAQSKGTVALVVDPAASASVQWAAGELEQALASAGWKAQRNAAARQFAIVAGLDSSRAAESFTLTGGSVIRATGGDARGLVYALLELADRVRCGVPLTFARPVSEQPANPVRSVMRQFTSEPLDKPWFNDRAMWERYLTMLATHRFNRFHLAFGLGYDDLKQVADSYFLFLYPFLVAVPGYDVRASNLDARERDRNLETLRWISEQSVLRGIDFELGVWMHGYRWPASPRAQHTIEGLTAENHAAYCRDALTAVLRACPAISSVALRIHGESGIAEGSYDFWRTVFDGVARCGRTVEIDLHAKGIDTTMIANAVATGMPVNVSPKYWAEHLGMPYHQAAIREVEMPVAGKSGAGLMTLSEGSRSATRYGYADLMRDDRRYTIRHRVFSGTQRLLASGDPEWTAAYSRAFAFCGSTGADLMEPLTCRGRRGTGAGRRSGYRDASLEPRWDWQKFAYWYRVWGRMLYNPADTEGCLRQFRGAPAWPRALASASHILPIVTTAYLPSAACDAYWPEVYWNQPLSAEAKYNPYTDTAAPKVFHNASPLDPQLFSRMNECADELLGGERSGKYSPLEVAQWLEDLAASAMRDRGRAASEDLQRLEIDIAIQAALGQFFAARFRGGVLYAIHERTGDRAALEQSLRCYEKARAAWAGVVARASGVYQLDLSASDKASERGGWADRLALIDEDIASARARLPGAKPPADARVAAAIAAVAARPVRKTVPATHHPSAGFRPREAVSLSLAVAGNLSAVRLHYRHVNQAERYQTVEMEPRANTYQAMIPASYTDSPYPIAYYFEGRNWLFPGFGTNLAGSPYFLIRRQT